MQHLTFSQKNLSCENLDLYLKQTNKKMWSSIYPQSCSFTRNHEMFDAI